MKTNSKSFRIKACIAAALLFALSAQAIECTNELPVKPGEWNSNFTEAKQLADEQHIPMVLFWGGASCSICQAVELALEGDEVHQWQDSRKLVMVFQKGVEGAMKDLAKNSSGISRIFASTGIGGMVRRRRIVFRA